MLKYFIFTSITEIFTTNMHISIFVSLFISIQILIIQFWFFLSPGLYKIENYKIFYFYLIFIIFNIITIFFIFIKIIPNIWYFFINMDFSNKYLFNIYFEPKLNNYFNFLFSLFFSIYLIFIYFLILFYLIFINLLKIKTIIKFRKIFYLKFLIISIFIAPPDIINQLIIIIFLFFIFEIYIYLYLFISQY